MDVYADAVVKGRYVQRNESEIKNIIKITARAGRTQKPRQIDHQNSPKYKKEKLQVEPGRGTQRRKGYRIPESLSAFCSIVSFTAANTSRIFDVSVACVRLCVT